MIGLVIMSGGQGRRMNWMDKGLCHHKGQSFINHILKKIHSSSLPVQVVISANRNIDIYEQFGFPVLQDLRDGFYGPLAGLESALKFGVENRIDRWITWPVDCLSLDMDYVEIMSNVIGKKTAVLEKNDKLEFAHLSVNVDKLQSVSSHLSTEDRSIRGWLKNQELEIKQLDRGSDHLFNINSSVLSV